MKRAGKTLLAIVGIVTVTGLLCLEAAVKEAAQDSSQLQKWVNRYGFL